MPEQNFLAPGPKQSEFNTLNSTVTSLSEQLANLITTEKYTITISESVGAGVSKSYSKSVTKSGYTPIGIIQHYGSGTGSFAFQDVYITGTDAMIYVRNVTSSTATLNNIQFVVLYMKS